MRPSRDFLWGTTFGLILAAAVWSVVLRVGRRPVDITVYPIMQTREGQRHPVGIATYRVDVAKQTVMYWRPGMVESPSNLANCAVRDVNNWRCEDQVGDVAKGVVEMQRGHYQESIGNGAIRYQGVTRQRWEEMKRRESER